MKLPSSILELEVHMIESLDPSNSNRISIVTFCQCGQELRAAQLFALCAKHPHKLEWKQPYVDLPKCPSKYTSHKEKNKKIEQLYGMLGETVHMLTGYLARVVIADNENGRLRNKLYGSKSKQPQVTCATTGE